MIESLRVGFAFSAGVATFFAPCAFPLLPGYVAYYLGRGDGDASLARAARVGGLASLGFLLVYGAIAAVVSTFGVSALADIALLEVVVGGLLVGLGVAMVTGRFSVEGIQLPVRNRSSGDFLLFGVVYALAAAGCTAPIFVGILFVATTGTALGAVAVLGAYAAGMVSLMLGVTFLSALGRDSLLRLLSRESGRVTRVAGALLALAGLAQIYLYVFDFDYLGGLRALGLA
ncbi:cytochrome c biogenesis CcdA family protein [Natronomonas sp. EA1]|uniref:cytochrome c biogenesis CcdA family protein n=1 Tax=Natronomonas sp. EA1 TaxID=3421655 RepID=UPI003EBD5058